MDWFLKNTKKLTLEEKFLIEKNRVNTRYYENFTKEKAAICFQKSIF